MATKTCNKCGEEKPLSEFDGNGAGRLRAACKPCERARRRVEPKPAPDWSNGKPCSTCGETLPLTEFRTRENARPASRCRSCEASRSRAYRLAHPEKSRDQMLQWRAANRETHLAARRRHREKHRAMLREKDRLYRETNVDKRRAYAALRRAMLAQATPPWADLKAIALVYAEADRLTAATGILHHVDHIVPLKGRRVCGLHVAWNLRPIPAEENRAKLNKEVEEAGVEYLRA